MMIISMIFGVIVCILFGIMNLYYYKRDKRKGNLYTSIFDFAVAIFMVIVLIIKF